MKNLNPYLVFHGNAEEAMNFYCECLGATIAAKNTFKEYNAPVPDNYKNNIMHMRIKGDGIDLMASDDMPNQPVIVGSNISLSLELNNEREQDKIFSMLSKGGKVTMPLENQIWGDRFGMLTDKYGINWMLNCHIEK
jgi:PhnB protein